MGAATDIFDLEGDVIVVGSGAAGFSAAVTAADEGASVILLEKADIIGGTTALSGGTAWIPNNHLMQAEGMEDPREEALRFLCRLAYPQYYDPDHDTLGLRPDDHALITTFYDNGSEAIRYLSDLGALDVEFDGETPDYHSYLAEDKAPYGRRVPQRRDPSADHAMGGAALFERFSEVARRLGVRVLLGRQAWSVLRNGDQQVVGLEVRAGRRTDLVRARKAIVFASGGFIHNDELVRRHLPGRVFGACASPGSTGDFMRIAQELGAEMGNTSRAWWKQMVVEQAVRSRHSGSVFFAFGDSMLFVNKYGDRVVNEKAPYHERGQVHLHWDSSRLEYPNLLLFMIWDDAVAQHPEPLIRSPVPPPGEHADHVIVGETLEALTRGIEERLALLSSETGGVRLDDDFSDRLARSIQRYGKLAEDGNDVDFGRGRNAIETKWHRPVRAGSPNPTMAPLSPEGPYYCTILGAGALDTNSGPRINTRAQVLGTGGEPIPGLYAAGNCVASITGQAYWGPGGTIGPAMTYGYLAGRYAAREAEKKVDW